MSKPITALRRGQCRFAITPDNAPSHLFCAEPVEHEKSPYCARHAAICFDRRSAEARRLQGEHMAMMRERRRAAIGALVAVPARILVTTASTVLDGDVS